MSDGVENSADRIPKSRGHLASGCERNCIFESVLRDCVGSVDESSWFTEVIGREFSQSFKLLKYLYSAFKFRKLP
jgi:hypothetical protein